METHQKGGQSFPRMVEALPTAGTDNLQDFVPNTFLRSTVLRVGRMRTLGNQGCFVVLPVSGRFGPKPSRGRALVGIRHWKPSGGPGGGTREAPGAAPWASGGLFPIMIRLVWQR